MIAQAVAVDGWRLTPGKRDSSRLVDWWTMAQFKGEELHTAIRILDTVHRDMSAYRPKGNADFHIGPVLLEAGERDKMEQALRFVEKTMRDVGLRTAGQAIRDFRTFLINWRVEGYTRLSPTEAAARIQAIHDTIRNEMTTHIFIYVPANRADFYEAYQDALWHSEDIANVRFGEQVAKNFPSVQDDIRSAGNCLALGEPTACVFHLMRVIERGLRALGAALNDPSLDPGKNPTWETILRKCDAELQKPYDKRSAEWRQNGQFFAEATANIRAVKDAWRKPSIHVESDYDYDKAVAVFRAVRSFMRHLATGLKEPTISEGIGSN